ncbi:2-amino-4-hydroxy-6-hydroxymethyldihydropteridine diphosphokinase [Actinomyces culturomici]|uniref:2-amino-4-hydroxy-6- hydroxymethyldihydropteridine diphosphokinase n=1 Tax=Actinomyces culturomici TaxID=1926276 RepID=UPI000E204726|nr:2-amino-4-hydroxy-6-hydroxymethyldihydropteridine diphosphokinase [Actinomyces culturomici]
MSRRLDVIALRGLAANGVHGVLPEEHRARQPFVVDLALWVDASEAARTDDIADTVSYAVIADEVAAILNGPSVRLIETLGHRIADAVLAHELVRGVEVTVHKPKAPIAQTFSDVSVTVRRGECGPLPVLIEEGSAAATSADSPEASSIDEGASAGKDEALEPLEPVRVLLALGGNIGDSPSILAAAVEALVDDARVDVLDVSPILRTAPVLADGQSPQSDYWNAVVLASTRLDPHGVLDLAHELESAAGRVRVEHWGPRTLDVDVVDYDGIALDEPDLVLPHPRARERAFVLAPWLMVDPAATLSGEPVARLLEEAPDAAGIRDAVDDWLLDPDSVIAESDAVLAAGDEPEAAPEPSEALAETGTGDETETPAGFEAPVSDEDVFAVGPAEDDTAAPVVYGPSRLDLVPEASRLGLAPKDDEDDVVWRRLWARWSAPQPIAPETVGASGAPAVPDASSAPTRADSANSTPEPPVVAERPARPQESAASDAAPIVSPEPVEGSDLVDPQPAPATDTAEDAPAESAADATAEVPRDPFAEPVVTVSRSPRRLPSWDFSRADVRIVDEPGAAQVSAAADTAPVRRSIVDPHLPEGALRGPIPDSELTRTGLLRKIVVRPSSTGAIPIVKDRDRR